MNPVQPDTSSSSQPPPTSSGVSLRRRVLIVASCLWAVIIFLIALNINVDRRYDDGGVSIEAIGLITGFTVFGIIPIGIAWGVAWILGAKRR